MKKQNIIIFSLQPWDISIGSNSKNIAREFSRKHNVLYVSSPLDIRSYFKGDDLFVKKRKKILQGKEPELHQEDDNLWILTPRTVLFPVNWLPKPIFPIFNFINNKKLARRVQVASRVIGFKNYIIFNDSHMFQGFYMPELLKPRAFYYYSRDNLLSVNFWQKHGRRHEPDIIKKSTACFANSAYLRNELIKHNPASFDIGQGCDFSEFDHRIKYERPIEVPVSKPVIGYVGAIYTMRLDLELIRKMVVLRPDYNFVFVGPEDEGFRKSDLHLQPNVFFAGKKKPEELPAFVQHFDVCINPQSINPKTIGNYPRKIDEYLAMGKPVVASRTETMEIFADHIYLAGSAAEYCQAIDNALEENSLERSASRIAFAKTHTWENSVNEIYKIMKNVSKN